MPTYAYKCRDCGRTLEVQQGFTDASLTACPTCGGALRKQYGTVGVTFNGSGFYRTDSRAKPEGSGGSDSGASSGSGDSGSTSGGEKKSADTKSDSGAAKPAAPATPATPKPAAAPAS